MYRLLPPTAANATELLAEVVGRYVQHAVPQVRAKANRKAWGCIYTTALTGQVPAVDTASLQQWGMDEAARLAGLCGLLIAAAQAGDLVAGQQVGRALRTRCPAHYDAFCQAWRMAYRRAKR